MVINPSWDFYKYFDFKASISSERPHYHYEHHGDDIYTIEYPDPSKTLYLLVDHIRSLTTDYFTIEITEYGFEATKND